MASEDKRLIESVFEGDMETLKATSEVLGDERAHRVLYASFALAVQRQFPGDYTPEQVSAFVEKLRGRMENPDTLKPMPTEALVRSALDEPELRQGIDMVDAFRGYTAVTHIYGKDHGIRGVERDDFVREVLEALA